MLWKGDEVTEVKSNRLNSGRERGKVGRSVNESTEGGEGR